MQAASKPRTIRLTTTSYAVLTLVEHLGQATPYDLKQALEKSIENFWQVPHTTFYAEPDRLASGGYLTLQRESSGRRRKIYSLTDRGTSALREWASSPDTAPPQMRDEGVLKIFAGADPASVFAGRRDWHLAKIEELQGYLDNLSGADPSTEASRATLIAGLTYHRMTLDAIGGFLAAVERDAR